MNQIRRWQRILFLSLLSISVLAPLVFVSNRLKTITPVGRREFIEELSNFRYRTSDLRLNAVEHEDGEGLKGPRLILYKDGEEFDSSVSDEKEKTIDLPNIDDGNNHKYSEEKVIDSQLTKLSSDSKDHNLLVNQLGNKTEFKPPLSKGEKNTKVHQSDRATDMKIKEIRDKIIQAKAYLNYAPPGSNSQIVKELRTRMRELERAVGDVTKDKDLSKGALRKLKPLEATLYKASRVFNNCPAIATKLRAMNYNTEELVQAQKNQASYLMHLAARTTPKGQHCLSMRLTSEYFALDPEKRQMPNQEKFNDPSLNHYVVFSDNVLASAVVANSTISSSKEPVKKGISEKEGRKEGRIMILAVLFANSVGNVLIERFNGVPAEERLTWRSFLVKLGAENLKGVKNEELLVACHKSVYIVYTMLGDVSIFLVGKDEYDELALAEAIFIITGAVKDICGKPPTERVFLDKYGRICLCLDEIVWNGLLENTDKDRIKRLIRLKPPSEF